MRPVSLKHLLTKPALLIAAGLVLLGAAAGRADATPANRPATPDGVRTCRAVKPSFDALCRCLSASLASEDEGAFAHVGLHAAFLPGHVRATEPAGVRVDHVRDVRPAPRVRLRQCPVGPSPPVV